MSKVPKGFQYLDKERETSEGLMNLARGAIELKRDIHGTEQTLLTMKQNLREREKTLIVQALKEGRTDLFSLNWRRVEAEFSEGPWVRSDE